MRHSHLQGQKSLTLAAMLLVGLAHAQSEQTETLAPTPTQPPAIELKGIALGASETQIKNVFPRAFCRATPNSEVSDSICLINKNTYAGVEADLFYFLIRDGVTNMNARFKSSDFTSVVDAFSERYGPPANTKRSTVTTKAGVSYDQIEHEWAIGTALVTARRFSSKVTEGMITIRTSASIAEFRERKDQMKKERAKDL